MPRVNLELIRELSIGVKSKLINSISQELSLDFEEKAMAHLEIAEKLLEDGRRLVDEVLIQASEKSYRATKNALKH